MANKHDLLQENPNREVSQQDMEDFTKRTGLTIFEASAKSGHGVESSFIALTEALMEESEKKKPIDNMPESGTQDSNHMMGYGQEAMPDNVNYNDY